ncbi:hypothetical protein BKA61DRAFT_603658 [Leptodontidium sp. MPI-SDFR-AT-0119]|nr:hypothetical protein BKA61DRAFT_603658 [Leptodontidium sp. MPI-SDFR-AT-0119]
MPVVSKSSESSAESSKLVYDNFYEWKLETSKELAAAGISEWVTNPPALPASASLQLAWRKEQKEARKIVVSSLSTVMFEKYQDLINAGDMKVLWDALQAAGTAHSSGAQHIANIKEELGKEVYNPSIESANDYVSRLRKYRLRLSGDTHPFTDADIKAKLIASLPRLGDWKIVRSALQNNPGDLEAVLHQLIEYQLQWKDELKRWKSNRGPQGRIRKGAKDRKIGQEPMREVQEVWPLEERVQRQRDSQRSRRSIRDLQTLLYGPYIPYGRSATGLHQYYGRKSMETRLRSD